MHDCVVTAARLHPPFGEAVRSCRRDAQIARIGASSCEKFAAKMKMLGRVAQMLLHLGSVGSSASSVTPKRATVQLLRDHAPTVQVGTSRADWAAVIGGCAEGVWKCERAVTMKKKERVEADGASGLD